MFNRLVAFVCTTLTACSGFGQPDALPGEPVVRYDGHRVVSVTLRDVRDVRTLEAIGIEPFVCELRHDMLNDFRVPPGRYQALLESGIPHEVVVENLQVLVDAERARLRGPQPRNASWFDDFKNLPAIESYMTELAALRPDLVTEIDLGDSLQGRPIRGLRIANDASDPGRCKPAILLNSVQHAREWITVMNNVFVADHLVRNYATDAYIQHLVDNADFYIIPVVNPDGYVYTWTTERFWRKNRRENAGGSFGVDLNRNWGYQWGISLPGGAGGNSNGLSEVYWGTGPFSEPETQRLRDFVQSRPEIKAHNDIHSYGQLILWSWGWTPSPIQHQPEWSEIGQRMRLLIQQVHGRSYTPGPIYTAIYPVSGSSVDWFYGELGALSLSYELRGPGFAPPAGEILLCAQETLPATLYQAEAMIERFQFVADWNRDCIHDIVDFLEFFADFGDHSPRSDLNGDGELDILDLLDFFQLFSEGR